MAWAERPRPSREEEQTPAELAAELDPYVRDKYAELWRAAQGAEPL